MKALLLSSTRQPYRRGGLRIGPKHAPTRITSPDEIEQAGLLAIMRDPVIMMATETEEDGVTAITRVTNEERAEMASAIEDYLAAHAAVRGLDPDAPETVDLVADLLADDMTDADTNTAPEDIQPAGADVIAPAAEGAEPVEPREKAEPAEGPIATPAAGKPARGAKPAKSATPEEA